MIALNVVLMLSECRRFARRVAESCACPRGVNTACGSSSAAPHAARPSPPRRLRDDHATWYLSYVIACPFKFISKTDYWSVFHGKGWYIFCLWSLLTIVFIFWRCVFMFIMYCLQCIWSGTVGMFSGSRFLSITFKIRLLANAYLSYANLVVFVLMFLNYFVYCTSTGP